MFSFLFRKPAPMIIDDIPAHRGFVVYITWEKGDSDTFHFNTLHEAQVYVFHRKAITRAMCRGFGMHRNRAPFRRYAIRNLETGKFAPYLWQLTRADVAA